MSLLPHPAELLHPSQVLTVEQAKRLVQQLIDHFIETVETLPRHSLDHATQPEYQALFEVLVKHASALEQMLCRICFFLPGEVTETVVAVVVLTHYQLSLLETSPLPANCVVLTLQTIADMSNYLNHVYMHLVATNQWIQSSDYPTLANAAGNALAEMRASCSSFVFATDHGRDDAATTTSNSGSSDASSSSVSGDLASDRFDELQRRLASLVPLPSTEKVSNVVEADRDILYRNFIPLVFSSGLPYRPPESYACGETDTAHRTYGSFSSSSTAYSDSSRPSLKGKERAILCESPEPFLGSPPWRVGSLSPFDIPFPQPSNDAEPDLPSPAGERKRRRSRTEDHNLRKKRRISITLLGLEGSLPDHSTHEAVTARVKPWIDQVVPLSGSSFPYHLPRRPSRSLALGPSTEYVQDEPNPSTGRKRRRYSSPSNWSTLAHHSFNLHDDPAHPILKAPGGSGEPVVQHGSDHGQSSVPSSPSWFSDGIADADTDVEMKYSDSDSYTSSGSSDGDNYSMENHPGSVPSSASTPSPPDLDTTPTLKRRRCIDFFLYFLGIR